MFFVYLYRVEAIAAIFSSFKIHQVDLRSQILQLSFTIFKSAMDHSLQSKGPIIHQMSIYANPMSRFVSGKSFAWQTKQLFTLRGTLAHSSDGISRLKQQAMAVV